MKPHIIQQGAEAIISLYKRKNWIFKDRIKKSYRIPELDKKIIKSRTKSEAKLLNKASEIINVPVPEKEYSQEEHFRITMPFINGKKLSDNLDNFPLKKQKEICKQIGEDVAKLHDENIIHGDLTTSNMILVENIPAHSRSQINSSKLTSSSFSHKKSIKQITKSSAKKSGKADFVAINPRAKGEGIYFIDFGLGFISHKFEDKAVDIHLLKQALEAKHFKHWETLFGEFSKGYKKSKDAEKTLNQLIKVEKRGRYKH